jgi:hypothetical protein
MAEAPESQLTSPDIVNGIDTKGLEGVMNSVRDDPSKGYCQVKQAQARVLRVRKDEAERRSKP